MRVAYVVDRFPCVSETFIWREVRELRRIGAEIVVCALRRGDARQAEPDAAEFAGESAIYLPRAWDPLMHARISTMPVAWSARHLRRVWKAVKGTGAVPKRGIRNLFHMSQGLALEEMLRSRGIQHVHAHFASLPSTLAWVACTDLQLPFSFSVHARDLYVESFLLETKVEAAVRVFACHSRAMAVLKERVPPALHGRIALMHHGLDLQALPPPQAPAPVGDREPFRVLGVGRMVEKKGFGYLVAAVALLKQSGIPVRLAIVGDGPAWEDIGFHVRESGLSEACELTGATPFQEVVKRMRWAHVLVCPSVVAADGDMDGLPNVVLEAQALGLPVVATDVGGLPDAVEHDRTGLLVRPADAAELARAIRTLREHPDLRVRIATTARAQAVARFDIRRTVAPLADLLGLHSRPDGGTGVGAG